MKTPDIRPHIRAMKSRAPIPLHADTQIIGLKRWCYTVENEFNFYLFTPEQPVGKRLYIEKSLRYASHSEQLGIYGASLLQTSLAICLVLYPVSRAIREHVDFAGRYLISLPSGNFHIQLTVPGRAR